MTTRQASLLIAMSALVTLTPLVVPTKPALAENLFVDNVQGDDLADASSTEPRGGTAGPVRSLRRALALARGHDTIVVANRGVPYYESLTIAGGRLQGTSGQPFVILGNGAVLDGSRPVPPSAWTLVGDDVWKMTPFRKGHYNIILDDRSVPGTIAANGDGKRPEIAVGEWLAFRGSVYLRVPPLTEPREQPYQFSALEVGLTLHDVKNVRISDLTFRNFRLDGVNAHDRARQIELINVTTVGNGRAGVSVNGTSSVKLKGCDLTGNRGPSLLVQEAGVADVVASRLDDAEPPAGERPEGEAPAADTSE